MARSRHSFERCSWCGAEIEPHDGFRALEFPGERSAAFCRLEHVVPWQIRGPHWEAGEPRAPSGLTSSPDTCALCGEGLSDVRVVLVRRRGEHRIPDAFCSIDHLAEWAKRGGRYA